MTGTDDDIDIRAREAVFEGYFRVDRYRLRHRLHEGGWSGEMMREVFERGHVVGVLPYDPVRDEVVLIEQFRIAAHAAGRPAWLTEVVAGIVEPGEGAEEVARRETLEEAGIEVLELLPIADYQSSPGAVSEAVQLFCARVDASEAGGVHGLDHEHEDIRVFTVPVAEALEMVRRPGGVSNAITLIALQWLALNHEDLRGRWAGGRG